MAHLPAWEAPLKLSQGPATSTFALRTGRNNWPPGGGTWLTIGTSKADSSQGGDFIFLYGDSRPVQNTRQ